MKKFRYHILSILLVCFAAVLLLCACGCKCGTDGACATGNGLVFNKKYVHGAFGEERENYFIFREDGTGDFVRNWDFEYTAAQHYTMHFKWFYADKDESAVVCFYDGWEKDPVKHEGASVNDDTTYLVTISGYVLCSNNGTSTAYYINEDYVDGLQNYAKD